MNWRYKRCKTKIIIVQRKSCCLLPHFTPSCEWMQFVGELFFVTMDRRCFEWKKDVGQKVFSGSQFKRDNPRHFYQIVVKSPFIDNLFTNNNKILGFKHNKFAKRCSLFPFQLGCFPFVASLEQKRKPFAITEMLNITKLFIIYWK